MTQLRLNGLTAQLPLVGPENGVAAGAGGGGGGGEGVPGGLYLQRHKMHDQKGESCEQHAIESYARRAIIGKKVPGSVADDARRKHIAS